MADIPTGTGQNLIIKNLQNILVALIIGLFTWVWNSSNTITKLQDQQLSERKDAAAELAAVKAECDARIEAIQKELNGAESDILDLQQQGETQRDDLKGRVIRVEDWQQFHSQLK